MESNSMIRRRLAEAEETIRKLGAESLRDQEKFRKAEEQVIRWLKKAGDLQAELGRVEKRLARMIKALEECDGEFDELTQVEDNPKSFGHYTGLRLMIEDALKE